MRNHQHKHTPEHSMRRMGAGTLVGFLALVGVAAAAAGVSSERNVRDLAQLRPSATNMRAAYGNTRTGYGPMPLSATTSTVTTTPVRSLAPVALLMLPTVGAPGTVVDISKSPLPVYTNGGVRVASFNITTNSDVPLMMKSVAVRMEAKKINAAAIKLAQPKTEQVAACGLLSFELRVNNASGSAAFAPKVLMAKNPTQTAWTFTGSYTLQPGVLSEVSLWAYAAVTNQQLVKLLEGCSFTPYLLAGDVRVQDAANKPVKTLIDGMGAGNKLTLPSVTIKTAESAAATVNMVWNAQSPVGPTSLGDDKTIAIVRVSNDTASSTSQSDVQFKGLPMNLNATFAPTGDRELKIYKDSISASNLVYKKILNAKSWRMDEKLGFYTLTAGSPFTAPVMIVAGSGKDFYVTYDVLDAKVNDTLCVAPTRTLSSFISSKVLQFPAGTTSPAMRCLNY